MFKRFLLPFLLSAMAVPVFCQTITASLQGVVKDPSGGVIIAATVTIVNTATNIATEVKTDSTGEYLAPSLPPGTYRIQAEAAGFKKVEQSGIILQVNQAARLDVAME